MNVKLTNEQTARLLELKKTTPMTHKQLGVMFGISPSGVTRAIKRSLRPKKEKEVATEWPTKNDVQKALRFEKMRNAFHKWRQKDQIPCSAAAK